MTKYASDVKNYVIATTVVQCCDCGSLIFYKQRSTFCCFGCELTCYALEGIDSIIKVQPKLLNKIISIYES